MKEKADKYDFEFAQLLVPAESEKLSAIFEDSLMEKILNETASNKLAERKKKRMVGMILATYISIFLLLTIILFSADSLLALNAISLSAALTNLNTPTAAQLLYLKVIAIFLSLSFLSFCIYFIHLRTTRPLAYK